MSAKPSVTRSALSAMSPGDEPVDHGSRAAGGADRRCRDRRFAADLHQAGPAVVEDPLRQVGELDADDIAEDREPGEGGERRRRRGDDADDDERPARR